MLTKGQAQVFAYFIFKNDLCIRWWASTSKLNFSFFLEQRLLRQYEDAAEFDEQSMCASIEMMNTESLPCPICLQLVYIFGGLIRQDSQIYLLTLGSPGISVKKKQGWKCPGDPWNYGQVLEGFLIYPLDILDEIFDHYLIIISVKIE